VTVPQACLDPASSDHLKGMYLDMIYNEKQVALDAILAASSAHMFSLGYVSESSFFAAKQRSLTSMITELNGINSAVVDIHHHAPVAVDDATLLAALLLLGPEIINAGSKEGPAQVRWLLQGARTLIVERHKYFACLCPLAHPGRPLLRYRLDSPIFTSCVRSLAFTDIITSVPCARRPVIHKKYWLPDALLAAEEGLRTMKPDPDLGYSADVLSLLGDAVSDVSDLLTKSTSRETFLGNECILQGRLDNAVESVQRHLTGDMTGSHAYNIAATTCLALATKIFLLRGTDFASASPLVEVLRSRLYEMMSIVPIENSASTTLLWPLWVLGCESYADSTRPSRHDVSTHLQRLYDSQRMKNVKQCLDTLRGRIWHRHAEACMSEQCLGCGRQEQSSWVLRCWQERIELLLA
jgi:hypothetical protein